VSESEMRPAVPECGVCASTAPAFRYDLPLNFVIMKTRDAKTGDDRGHGRGLSDVPADGAETVRARGAHFVELARRLATRLADLHLGHLAPEHKKRARKNAETIYERLIPLLSNERPFVDGEHSHDRVTEHREELVINPDAVPPDADLN
jgi:hypothetical protein